MPSLTDELSAPLMSCAPRIIYRWAWSSLVSGPCKEKEAAHGLPGLLQLTFTPPTSPASYRSGMAVAMSLSDFFNKSGRNTGSCSHRGRAWRPLYAQLALEKFDRHVRV